MSCRRSRSVLHYTHQEPLGSGHEPLPRKRGADHPAVDRVLHVVVGVIKTIGVAGKDDEDHAAEADGEGDEVVEDGAGGRQGGEAHGVVGNGHHLPAVVEEGDGDLNSTVSGFDIFILFSHFPSLYIPLQLPAAVGVRGCGFGDGFPTPRIASPIQLNDSGPTLGRRSAKRERKDGKVQG